MIAKLHKIRLFLQPKKESYFVLKQILGFSPKHVKYYRMALLHKSSFRDAALSSVYENNERLEFLGDAILDAVIAELVFKHFPKKDEGFLTNTRSKIVKRESLDRIAYELGLSRLITSSTRNNSPNSHILGNALEAFIGAVFLDQGFEKTKKFIENKIIKPYIDIDEVAGEEVNFKSKLLEWSQRYKVELNYGLSDNSNEKGRHLIFESEVFLNGLLAGTGTGHSKKISQQDASKSALEKIRSDKKFRKEILDLNKKESESPTEENLSEEEETTSHQA